MKVSVVNSVGDKVFCNYAGLEVLLQSCRWYFVTVVLLDLSVAIIQMTVSVAIIQLVVFAALVQMTVSGANTWVTTFIVIMRVVFSSVHYAHDCFYCNNAGDCFCCSYVGDSFQ